MNERSDFERVSATQRCLVCNKPDWCLRTPDGSAAICARTPEGAVRRVGTAGWLFKFGPDQPRAPRHSKIRLGTSTSFADLTRLAEQFQREVDPERLKRFASSLGLSASGLERLGVGWADEYRAWAFPMVGPDDRVIGVRLRLSDGRKISIRGGHEGLFIPKGASAPNLLCIAEGPTDTCALLDLGFDAIGRPSCCGGTRATLELVRRLRPARVAIVADGDAPGQEGAKALADRLAILSRWVSVVAPPASFKDVRAWKNAGATRADVMDLIESSAPERSSIRTTIIATSPASGRRRHGR